MNRDVKLFVRDCERAGLRCVIRNHIKVYQGNRMVLVIGSSPSDHRWRKNMEATLKRQGVAL